MKMERSRICVRINIGDKKDLRIKIELKVIVAAPIMVLFLDDKKDTLD